ncbi:Type 1 glutamine amidotransferase-like domain-containing protein [Actinomadura barringtoniae]|uniref:Type 1 glutamine amidotransferase-like domain-containing protein n=1 Tax=Actinomadura barringtoniae TaxID=1427535 RepID=A0A939PIK1_9ACTN|nr:Type 1 glutamine amidotransferase-like domain-containing protein [Actinomadura barringtoniae]MBO2452833.1 Type 1 glutamine amidotransferase-like domain-containing protein [Actinomadura barringtoniae]
MRLYLSSFRLGDRPDRLMALLDAPRGVAVIANAIDDRSLKDRAAGAAQEIEVLTGLGLRPTEIDLRDYYDKPAEAIARTLGRFRTVWVRGGNVFALRYAMARSGADRALTALLAKDALVYAGYSAGACVLAPSLRGLETCDDPSVAEEVIWDGLGVLDYVIVPHVDSPDHPESEVLTALAARYRAEGVAHQPLRDGQALVVEDADFSYTIPSV